MDILQKADHILRNGSVEEVQSLLPDLLHEYCKIDKLQGELEMEYELSKIQFYFQKKKDKKAGEIKMSDRDIENRAKLQALQKYGDHILYRKTANHYKLYIQELSQKKIDIQVLNKAMREGI